MAQRLVFGGESLVDPMVSSPWERFSSPRASAATTAAWLSAARRRSASAISRSSAARSALRLGLLLELAPCPRRGLEGQQRPRHVADLVPPLDVRNARVEISVGGALHRARDRRQRAAILVATIHMAATRATLVIAAGTASVSASSRPRTFFARMEFVQAIILMTFL